MTLPLHFSGENLTCIRGGRVVFTRLSFTIGPGEVLLLVGPNGSGKSSLLRILAGLLPSTTGSLFRNGQLIKKSIEYHTTRTRYIGHLDAIKPTLSIAETLIFASELSGIKHHMILESAIYAMDYLSLSHLASVQGRFLSAGQKRKTNLARLLLGFSDLWLLDEPTTTLDRSAIFVLSKMIEEHRGRGGGIVFSTNATVNLPVTKKIDMRDFILDPFLR